MARAVQYRGRKEILNAFDNTGIVAWALSYPNHKQIVGKHAGGTLDDSKEALENLLKSLEKGNTAAEYTLSFYEDVKDRRKIKLSLEPDISYNVLLFDNEDNPSPAFERSRGLYSQVMDRLDIIDAKLATKPDEEEQEEEESMGSAGGFIGAINKILDNPRVQEQIGEKFMAWVDKLMTPAPQIIYNMDQPAAMGSMGPTDTPQITVENAQKIQDAVEILARIDPNLGDNLEKIAQLAQKNPNKYFSAIKMLNII